MDLNQLWTFYLVAKHKSFSRAAETLAVTQPMISIKIKQLEDAYKVRLFERYPRKIELTNAGETLFSYAERIFNILEEANSLMEDMKGIKFGTLKISAGLTLGTYYLPVLLGTFRKKYPNIEIQMKVKNKQEVVQDILSFKDDFGFTGHMEPDEKLVITPLWEEELLIIVSPSHTFAKMKMIPLSKLNGHPLILRERGSGTRELIEERLKAERVAVKVVMELGSHEAISRAVEAGLGLSVVPMSAVKGEIKAGRLRALRLPRENIVIKYSMIYHKEKYFSHIMQAFHNMVMKQFPGSSRGTSAGLSRVEE